MTAITFNCPQLDTQTKTREQKKTQGSVNGRSGIHRHKSPMVRLFPGTFAIQSRQCEFLSSDSFSCNAWSPASAFIGCRWRNPACCSVECHNGLRRSNEPAVRADSGKRDMRTLGAVILILFSGYCAGCGSHRRIPHNQEPAGEFLFRAQGSMRCEDWPSSRHSGMRSGAVIV